MREATSECSIVLLDARGSVHVCKVACKSKCGARSERPYIMVEEAEQYAAEDDANRKRVEVGGGGAEYLNAFNPCQGRTSSAL
jgi:hypothetical protein